jgi:Fe-S cluster assembly scaffold protein SufB
MQSSSDFNLPMLMPEMLSVASPMSKDLFWRHCDFKSLFNHHWSVVQSDHDFSDLILAEMDLSNAIVFVNGRYSDVFSNHDDTIQVTRSPSSNEKEQKDVKNYFRNVNTQCQAETYHLSFSQAISNQPLKIIHYIHADDPLVIPLNLKLTVKSGYKGSFEFQSISNTPHPVWINQCIDFNIASDAQLSVYELYDHAKNLKITHTSTISLDERSYFKQFIAHKHFDFMYYQQDVYLNDCMAQWQCNGFIILKDQQKSHYRFKAHHIAKKTVSKQFMRALLSDASFSLWDSSVVVYKGAKGTDSSQLNHNLLLGEKAKVHSIPILEIDEDDVKSAHGSTVGALDKAMLFYLQSRGLSAEQSLSLMKRAFIAEVIHNFDDQPNLHVLQKYLHQHS